MIEYILIGIIITSVLQLLQNYQFLILSKELKELKRQINPVIKFMLNTITWPFVFIVLPLAIRNNEVTLNNPFKKE